MDNKAQLIYVNQTFLKYALQGAKASEKASLVLSRALFYDEHSKSWQNPFSHSPRSQLDFMITQNEFNEKKWILLKKNPAPHDSQKYTQDGPFSTREIFEMIQRSEVRLEDPIWKEGLSKWTAIKKTSTFKELETLSKPLEADVADLLSSVVEYDPEMHRVENQSSEPGEPGEFFVILDDK